ncbi:MAG: FAD-dependent oxidoreductase [Burkholderiales bacterium]
MPPPEAFASYPFRPVRHAPRLPALDNGIERRRHRVAIVGGGPVGLATALGLARHGVASVLIEADDAVCEGSRAICVSRRSLEILDRLGAAKAFLRTGLPWTGGRSFYRDTEVLRFSMPQDENQRLPPMVNLAQFHIEQFLLDTAETLPDLVDVRWASRVTRVEPRPDGVVLDIATAAGGYQMEADWVVACDGGRSFVRERLGLVLEGTTYEGRYVIVDIAMRSARPTERLAYFDPACNPGSTVLVHKQPDHVWRVDYQLRDDESPEMAALPENVMPRVQSVLDMMGETAPWAPIWISLYRANARSLRSYRHGRVLFAGDAAHLMPIFGVRGANSGIDDADNLAWKLAFVVRGIASERLIDSYSSERVAAAHENLRHGAKSTEFMAPPSFAFDLMRRAVLSLAVEHPAVRSLINPRQTLPIAYRDSPLNLPSNEEDRFAGGPAPGCVLPECPLRLDLHDGPHDGHLTELLGPCFTAFHFSERGTLPARIVEDIRDMAVRGIPYRVVSLSRSADATCAPGHAVDSTGRLFPMMDAAPGTLYLVRPDGHVLARWRDGDNAPVKATLLNTLGRWHHSTSGVPA